MKEYIKIFFLGFFLNFIWENLHSLLYLHYRGGPISQLILLRASLVDALIIVGLIFFLRLIFKQGERAWLLFFGGLAVAVFLEKWALGSGRWQYREAMPLIPFLGVGLTPAVQLGFLAYLINWLVFVKNKLDR